MVLTASDLDQSDGQFIVTEGFNDSDGLADGWIVTHRETGLFTWITESSGISVPEAKGRILREVERRAEQ